MTRTALPTRLALVAYEIRKFVQNKLDLNNIQTFEERSEEILDYLNEAADLLDEAREALDHGKVGDPQC